MNLYLSDKLHNLPRVPNSSQFASVRSMCGNVKCTGSLFDRLKDRRRPIFEGQWGCSTKCLRVMVEAKLRRESLEYPADREQHRHRMPLGLVMLTQGWITREQLQAALIAQRQAGTGRIGAWLIARCGLTEDQVTRALAMQWRCPVLTTEEFEPGRMALMGPSILFHQIGMVPLRVASRRTLYVGFEETLDQAASFALERMNGLEVRSGLVQGGELRDARQRLCASQFIESTVEQALDVETVSHRVALVLSSIQPRASCLVRLHQYYWLRMWLEAGAMSSRNGGLPAHRQDVLDCVYVVAPVQ